MELMYQRICLKEIDKIKDNIVDMQFPLHNITTNKIQKYLFILLLNELC